MVGIRARSGRRFSMYSSGVASPSSVQNQYYGFLDVIQCTLSGARTIRLLDYQYWLMSIKRMSIHVQCPKWEHLFRCKPVTLYGPVSMHHLDAY